MKKLSLLFAIVMGLFMTLDTNAQTTEGTFEGKWNVTIFDTPNGDAQMTFVFENKDGKLNGVVLDTNGGEMSKVTGITMSQNDKRLYGDFTAEGYDINIMLNLVDNDHVKGNVMDMFDASGVRIKENQ
ncbi:hypothetical protein [Albibacterium bauzanense]|uniref:Lipocalin-like protein n=1 Tax=Albibacterium bauzanense TaxID=653929 RepID=A0A4R1LUT5_9SPHI|nr:hypothetical protein [Albibacterium bauzanense]TCK83118.1 hypothetical protein C8N28_1707 [Albibacterium bauzanense]